MVGCYLDFPFCQTLLDDWRTTRRTGLDVAFTQLLDSYPHGYEKAKESDDWREGELPRWDAVRAALLEIREACGLTGDPRALEDTERRHTRALIDNFLAHAARYESTDDAAYGAAAAHYDEAVELFEADDDTGTRRGRASSGASSTSSTGASIEARADWERSAELARS